MELLYGSDYLLAIIAFFVSKIKILIEPNVTDEIKEGNQLFIFEIWFKRQPSWRRILNIDTNPSTKVRDEVASGQIGSGKRKNL